MSEHIVPTRIYYAVFTTLMVLTVVTALVAFVDLGAFSPVVALVIATFKALIVILFFMHVRYSPPLTWVVLGAGFFWLGILIFLTLSDYISRPWMGDLAR